MENITAGDLMTRDVLMVRDDWEIDRLAEFLVENSISGAPVVDGEDKLVGVVSMTDIARYHSLPIRDTSDDAHDYYHPPLELQLAREEMSGFGVQEEGLATVRDIMTPVVFQVEETARLPQVAETMIRGRIHRLFVTREGQVIGIITAFDLLKVITEKVPVRETPAA